MSGRACAYAYLLPAAAVQSINEQPLCAVWLVVLSKSDRPLALRDTAMGLLLLMVAAVLHLHLCDVHVLV